MRKIMVIDDDEILRLLYAEELHEEGYDVVTAGAAPDLMGMVDTSDPDVIILDERLRRHGGVDLIKAIRERHHSLPIILATLSPPWFDGQAADDEDYMVKGSDMVGLKDKIRRVFAALASNGRRHLSALSGAVGAPFRKKGRGQGGRLENHDA